MHNARSHTFFPFIKGKILYSILELEKLVTQEEILNYLKEIKPILISSHNITKIGLFGSYSTNEDNENSDIDIIVEYKNDDVDVEKAVDHIKILVGKKFNRKVDVANGKYLFPLFRDRILQSCIYV